MMVFFVILSTEFLLKFEYENPLACPWLFYTPKSDLWERHIPKFVPVSDFSTHLYQINLSIWEIPNTSDIILEMGCNAAIVTDERPKWKSLTIKSKKKI